MLFILTLAALSGMGVAAVWYYTILQREAGEDLAIKLWPFFAWTALGVALVLAVAVWFIDPNEGWLGGMSVEGFGLLADIILFGVIQSILQDRRERRKTIRDYRDQLTDFTPWEGQEAVLRKAGIIKRLNELKAPLPHMTAIYLVDSPLVRANLSRTELGCANFRRANLIQADFVGANLLKADLSDAKLGKAKLQRTNLYSANLQKAVMIGTNLEGSNLAQTMLDGADIMWARLGGTANAELDQIQKAKNWEQAELPDYIGRKLIADGWVHKDDDVFGRWYKPDPDS